MLGPRNADGRLATERQLSAIGHQPSARTAECHLHRQRL